MLFVLSVTASFAAQFTLTGIVTRNGEPCPYARVVITEQGLLPPSEFVKGTMTNQYGWYQVTKLESANSYAITVNALNAVPVIRQPFESSTSTVTLNIDLQYGRTPLYDDFSGSSVDLYDPFFNPNGKWEYFNPQYDPTGTIASITEEGTLKIDPAMGRSGIASTTAFPPCSSYECVLPKAHEGALLSLRAKILIMVMTISSIFGIRAVVLMRRDWLDITIQPQVIGHQIYSSLLHILRN